MHSTLKNDLEILPSLLETAKQQGLNYLNEIDTRATSVKHSFQAKSKLDETGTGTLGALNEFNQRLEPLMVASSGSRYWGFVTGGTTPAAMVGDWLTSVYDQNAQKVKGDGDISANIEIETIGLLLDLFGLPNDFFGGFVTGATMSNFTCLGVGRQWAGKQQGRDVAKDGVTIPIKVLTATPHSSAIKSLAMLGMDSNNITKVKVLEGNREAMDVVDLENHLKALAGAPAIVIASGGTVNTVDFDDFVALRELKSKYNFWLHIDAAFGGFAACSRAHQHLLQGWGNADSITIDCHKWLNVPYESALFFIKQKHNLLQVETFQNSNAPYLGNPMENFDYLNFLPENSRRLKALPAWFTLIAYGKKGISDIVDNNIQLAKLFGNYIEQHPAFELLAPVRLNTVCFTLRGEKNPERVQEFLFKLNATGKVFMTPTVYNGRKGIRAALVNWRTTKTDVEMAVELMNKFI
ncbi:MAG: aspartate aminotransferase family protein [Bacteroidetes bacterium]|nr:aspartate aminotransferase family protein [Bacteroidota bacterium]